jgi:hypothetical protein
MPLSYGNLTGAAVQDYELLEGAATINVKFTVGTIAANATGTQASGTLVPGSALSSGNIAVTSAGSAYSITLPPSQPGMEIDIVCITTTNTVTVFPSAAGTGTEKINALTANSGLVMGALTSATFMCMTAGQWWTSPRVPS